MLGQVYVAGGVPLIPLGIPLLESVAVEEDAELHLRLLLVFLARGVLYFDREVLELGRQLLHPPFRLLRHLAHVADLDRKVGVEAGKLPVEGPEIGERGEKR